MDVGRLGAFGAGDAGAKGKPARKGEEEEFRGKGRWKNALPPLSCPLGGVLSRRFALTSSIRESTGNGMSTAGSLQVVGNGTRGAHGAAQHRPAAVCHLHAQRVPTEQPELSCVG